MIVNRLFFVIILYKYAKISLQKYKIFSNLHNFLNIFLKHFFPANMKKSPKEKIAT